MAKQFKTVTCKNTFFDKVCNWVSFEVTRKFAESEVKKFNEYFDTLTKQKQEDYYGGSGAKIESYEHCFRCGGSYKNFKKATKDEIPNGSTINPIISKKD